MSDVNVQPELMRATLTLEEASSNIEKAKAIDVNPDAFIENKELNQVYQNRKTDLTTTGPVAKKLQQSRTIASVMKDEVPIWTRIDNVMKDIGNSISGVVPEWVKVQNDRRRLNQLNNKSIDEKLSPQESYEIRRLEARINRWQQQNPGLQADLPTSDFAKGAAQEAAGSVLDIGRAIIDNPEVSGTLLGIPATIGAVRGIPGGPLGIATGAGSGLLGAATVALPAIQLRDAYVQTRGSIYADLSKATNDQGVPLNIPKSIRDQYATGGALVSAVFEAYGLAKILGNVPIVKRMKGRLFSKAAQDAALQATGRTVPASAAERKLSGIIKAASKIAAVEGSTEIFQTFVEQAAKEGAQTFRGVKNDTDFIDGLGNLFNKYIDQSKTLAKNKKLTGELKELVSSGIVGAAAGPVATGTLTVATEAVAAPLQAAGTARRNRAETRRAQAREAIMGRLNEKLLGLQTIDPNMPRAFRGAQGLEAKLVVEELVKATGDTNLYKLQPAEANQLIADIAQDAGVPFMWMDPDDARAFSTDEQKGRDIRALFGSEADKNAAMDAQVKINTALVIDFVRKYPETSGMFSLTPETLSANEYLRKVEETKAKQQEVLGRASRLGPQLQPDAEVQVPAQDTVEEVQGDFFDAFTQKVDAEAATVQLTPEMTDEQILGSFETREQAEAYLDRLESERKPLFHGTRGPEFDQLDSRRSGGMIFFGETPEVAQRYAQGGGGGRVSEDTDTIVRNNFNTNETLQYDADSKTWKGQWNNENVSFTADQVNSLQNNQEASLEFKSARTIESSYNPKEILDITENAEVLKQLIEPISSTNKSARKILADSNINAAFWNRSKFASRSPEINAEMQEISNLLENAGYKGIRFKDDQHVTVALFSLPNQDFRQRIQRLSEQLPSELEAVTTMEGDLVTGEDRYGTQAYVNDPVVPAELRDALPEKTVSDVESMNRAASQEYVDAIMDTEERDFIRRLNVQEQIALTIDREMRREELRNDPNIQIVENFIGSTRLDPNVREMMGIKTPKTSPAFAINPETLTATEREQYLNNENMKARKVFNKKGMSIVEAASLLGVSDTRKLLDILANTPTLDEAVNTYAESKAAEITSELAVDLDFDETRIAKALDNKSKALSQALNYFKNKDWSTYKKVLKIVTQAIPRVPDLRSQAQRDISNTRIQDLNVGQYAKGEQRSKRKAQNSFLRGDLAAGFDHIVDQIRNVEHMRATHKAIRDVNKRTKKVAKFFTPRVKNDLERAGQKYVDAIEDIMQAFNLSPYAVGQAKQDAYRKLAEDMANRGQGDIALPEHIVADFDPRLGWESLTVQQYNEIVDLMDNVLALARQKNRAIQSYTGRVQDSQMSLTEEAVILELADHPARDERRAEQQAPETVGDIFDSILGNLESLVSNTNFAVRFLDRDRDAGLFQRLIVDRLKGVGAFDGPWGQKARDKMRTEVREAFTKAIKEYGVNKFNQLGTERVTIPEFQGINGLNNGNLTKLDLFVLATYMGNDGNIDRLTNFDIAEEVWWEVFDTHLGVEEFTLIQNGVWNIYKSFEDRVVALEKLDGDDVELVKAKPFVFKGIEFPGGYAPIQYATTPSQDMNLVEKLKDMFKKEDQGYSANYAARGMTARGYTEKRVGSDMQPSFNILSIALGFEEHITDITMRIPVRDSAKILGRQRIKNEIINVIGKERYRMMIDGLASYTTTEDARRMNAQIQGEAFLDRFFTRIESAQAVAVLGLNISSLMIQPLSLGTAVENMGGARGVKNILGAVTTMAVPWNWFRIKNAYDLAVELNPSIKNRLDNIDQRNAAGIMDILPTRRVSGSKTVNMFAKARDFFIKGVMYPFSVVDISLQLPVTLGAYRQYMRGEAPGQDAYAFWQMSPEEQKQAAASYVRKITESSLTHGDEFNRASIQRTALGRRFSQFFNDLRVQLNTTIMSARQLKWNFKEAGRLAIEGDLEGSAAAYNSTADKALTMTVISLAMAAYEQMIRGAFSEEEEDQITPASIAYGALKARTFGAAPLAREITFAGETGLPVGIPITRAGESIVAGVSGMATLLNNYTGLLNDTEMDKELTATQMKGLLSSMSMFTKGIPVNGPYKVMKAATEESPTNVGPERIVLGAIGLFLETAERFINRFKDDESMEPIVDQVRKDVETVKAASAAAVPYEISDIDLKAFRFAENPQGKWNAENSETEAFGHYQILPSTWRDIVNRAPTDLGLTEDGLYDRDGKQAEAGIKWYIQDNARILARNGVEVNLTNIYGAHHFGASGWTRVLNADPSTPKEDVFSKRAIRDNPWLQKENIVTAEDAIKFVKGYINRARYRALRDKS